jgi:exodeoxyribonuclease VII small subunit
MDKIKPLTYEQAFAELEKIVAELEGEINNLDKAMELFERGQALAKHCSALLEKAELKVQQLSGDGELSDLE